MTWTIEPPVCLAVLTAISTAAAISSLLRMPEMDVFTATAAIRKLDGPARDITIIALTVNAKKDERKTYISAGKNDYVTKPI